jgi:hypothetical protein
MSGFTGVQAMNEHAWHASHACRYMPAACSTPGMSTKGSQLWDFLFCLIACLLRLGMSSWTRTTH